MSPHSIAIRDLKLIHHVLNEAMGYLKSMGSKFQPRLVQAYVVHRNRSNASWRSYLDIDNIHIKADACGGDVTIRSYAYLRTSTTDAHSQFAIYGDPRTI